MASKRNIKTRRQQVLRYYLKGLNTDEIARQLKVHRATIYRDVEELEVWLQQHFDRAKAYTVKRAYLTRMEIFREAWSLYHRKPPEGKDDFFRKVAALPIVMKAQSDLEKLAGIADLKIEVESSQAEIEAKLLRMFTDLLMKFPPDLRKLFVDALPDDFKLQRDSDDKDGFTEIQ